MREFFIKSRTLPQAYHEALEALSREPVIPCPAWGTRQKELSVTMAVEKPLDEPMISRLSWCDPYSLERYLQEMLDGVLDFEVERGKWKYTYHSRYAPQLPALLAELRKDPYSRRAVLDLRDPSDIGSEDPACWQHAQFLIRDDALHCKVLFRSNDACKAAFMNAFAIIMIQKRLADELGVDMGSYTHRANSFHCYERDFDTLDAYVERYNSGAPTTYRFQGEWEELMLAERPAVERAVKELRGREERTEVRA